MESTQLWICFCYMDSMGGYVMFRGLPGKKEKRDKSSDGLAVSINLEDRKERWKLARIVNRDNG